MVCKGMKFTRFPLDEHVCYLKLTSCKYFYYGEKWDIIWLVAGMLDLNFPLQKIVNTFFKSESLQDVISGGETSNLIFFDQISLRICTLSVGTTHEQWIRGRAESWAKEVLKVADSRVLNPDI